MNLKGTYKRSFFKILPVILLLACLLLYYCIINKSSEDIENSNKKSSKTSAKSANSAQIPLPPQIVIKKKAKKILLNTASNVSVKPFVQNNKKEDKVFTVLESNSKHTLMKFKLDEYEIKEKVFMGRKVSIITHPRAAYLKQKDAPALPAFRTNIIIPDDDGIEVVVSNIVYEDISISPPVPSAGFISRSVDRKEVIPDFGKVYRSSRPFPEKTLTTSTSYKIRNIKAVGLNVSPFQYFPSSQKLRVFKSMDIELKNPISDKQKPLLKTPVTREFAQYANVYFSNYRAAVDSQSKTVSSSTNNTRGIIPAMRPETGSLLIIVPDDLQTAVTDFVTWKKERGVPTTVKIWNSADVGASGRALMSTYITQQYANDSNLAFVIFIGDEQDMPSNRMTVPGSTTNATDTLYTLQSGNDKYHDLFISRVSASTVEAVTQQLKKFIDYEKTPTADTSWYTSMLLVGSNDGATISAFGKYDWQILEEEWDKSASTDDLLGYGYNSVTKLYDVNTPKPLVSDVLNAVDAGVSLVYYLGHGNETQWITSGFNVTNTQSFNNSPMLPFIMNANCQNGNFARVGGDSLSEAMMKSGTPTAPAGAIGVIASVTNMSWDPPIVMLQAFSDIIINNSIDTLGALVFYSIQKAMDWSYQTASEGVAAANEIMEQTHLFGDCTLGFRTTVPLNVTVTHANVVIPLTPYDVTVLSSTGQALVGVAVCLYDGAGTQIIAYTNNSGIARLNVTNLLTQSLTLTVYQRNIVPYQTTVQVGTGNLAIYSTSTLPNAVSNLPFTFTHIAAGGLTPYIWSSSNLPSWLTLSSTGEVSGTPTLAGTYSYTMNVSDANSANASQAVTLFVGTAVQITTNSLTPATVEQSYSFQLTSSGDFTPFSYELVSGTLPSGVNLSSDGSIAGRPLSSGTYSVQIKASDLKGKTDTVTLNLQVIPSSTLNILTAPTLNTAKKGYKYSKSLSASGGNGKNYSWSLSQGSSLPAGLFLTSSGNIQGTPLTEGTYTFAITVSDSQSTPVKTSKTFTLLIDSAVYFSNTNIPYALINQAYNFKITAQGTYNPITYSQVADNYGVNNNASTFTETGLNTTWKTASSFDDNEWTLNFDFPFIFYGTQYTSCRVSNNGYIILGSTNPSPDPTYDANENAFANLTMIAPFWSDLVIINEYPETGIFVTKNTESATIRWKGREFHNLLSGWLLNFSVTLFKNGNITFSYGNIQTTNRVVVGISNNSQSTMQLIYSHSWSPLAPNEVTGWANHDDINFSNPQLMPAWLTLQSDGTLTGIPPNTNSVTFTVIARDAQQNSASADLTLDVFTSAPTTPDKNSDNIVSDIEILEYIDRWSLGEVSEAKVNTALTWWKTNTPPIRRNINRNLKQKQTLKKKFFDVNVRIKNKKELDSIINLGFDVTGRSSDIVRLYITQDNIQTLIAMGFNPEIAKSAKKDRGVYYTYSTMTTKLQQLIASYPAITQLVSIGKSVQNRDLWAIKITDNPLVEELEPEVNITSTIHGDEPLGTEMCIRFIEYLLSSYGNTDADGVKITNFINSTQIWILPLLNPDGYEASPRTRHNANDVDLNRNFPDGVLNNIGNIYDGPAYTAYSVQPEVSAMMTWSASHNFVISTHFHTGDLLVAYPYGNNLSQTSVYSATPDDATFIRISQIYTFQNQTMWNNLNPPLGITNSTSWHGVVNAADWYRVTGEMADWKYRYLGTFETTIELSVSKEPPSSLFDSLWISNKTAMLEYLNLVHSTSISGTVTDSSTGEALYAKITLANNDKLVFSDSTMGDYYRLVEAGTYSLTYSANGYYSKTLAGITVINSTATIKNVTLDRITNDNLALSQSSVNAKYVNEKNPLTLQININNANPPNAYIVTENIPQSWKYVAGSSKVGTTVLADPQQVDNTLKWIFWGANSKDTVLNYELMPPYTATQVITLDGGIQTSVANSATIGLTTWTGETANKDFTIDMIHGWNLFSIPAHLNNTSMLLLFSSLDSIWTWDGSKYINPNVILPGVGYWGHSLSIQSIQLSGTPVLLTETNIRLFKGWNILGPLNPDLLPAKSYIMGYVWYVENDMYKKANNFQLFKGYWLFSDQNVFINLK